jgi:hypothetical protein
VCHSSDDISELKKQLSSLGATHVLTYDDLADKTLRDRVKEWTNGIVRLYREEKLKFLNYFHIISQEIRLALNCVGP